MMNYLRKYVKRYRKLDDTEKKTKILQFYCPQLCQQNLKLILRLA